MKLPKAVNVFISRDFDQLFDNYSDPWNFEKSAFEKKRFKTILELTKSVPHARILEIGSAEGHLTQDLANIAENLTAIEISAKAIERSKKRAPGATYLNVSFENFTTKEKFDLVILSEVFYYLKNKEEAISKISKITDYIIVSSAGIHQPQTSKYFSKFKPIQRKIVKSIKEIKITTVSLYSVR